MKSWRRASAIVLIAAVLACLFPSCGKEGKPSASSDPPVVYYNGFYGLEVTVPSGWIVESVDEKNMTKTPEESGDPKNFHMTPYDDSGSGMKMIELWNREETANREHASMLLYLEIYEGIDEASYLDAFEEAYAGDFNGYYSTFVSREAAELNGDTYTRLTYSTTLPPKDDKNSEAVTGADAADSTDTYYEEYYIRQMQEGKFLVVGTTYWADNEISQQDSAMVLKSFKCAKPS